LRARTFHTTSKTVAQRFLELQYGWRPLLSDVYAASVAYEKLTKGPRISTLHVHGNSQCNSLEFSASPSNYTCVAYGKSACHILYQLVEDLPVTRSLGLSDPLSVVWELTPFSFVADWFLPIGQYLENLSIIPYLNGRSCQTRVVKAHGIATPINMTYYSGCKSYGNYLFVQRDVGPLSVIPTFPSFKPWDKSLSSIHIANAIALIRSAIH